MPFRLKPRIFPEVVSATVAVSEAITRLRPQTPAANLVFEAASVGGCDAADVRKITEPANPAPRVAIPPMKERRSLKAGGPDSRFGFFDVVPASDFSLSNGAILDAL
jgi:hypothetical protein